MIDYKRSGVDIDKSDSFIEDITKMVSATKRREVIGNIGGKIQKADTCFFYRRRRDQAYGSGAIKYAFYHRHRPGWYVRE